ncbi:MAG: lipid-A-disaccharide synthase [Saprospiraceae bacterium]|nr:lipid-A-disaccharide synthase [Saprospiraceae bacterium]
MKLYVIAGEASGDLHGSNLLKALFQQHPGLQVRAWGGHKMQEAGATLVKHYKDLAFMGFVEVVKNLRTILHNISFCKKDILAYQPDALVLIDYPGFNLRIAKWAKRQGIKVIYYISPQIWAWHRSRVHDIRRDVDKMLVILPFEQDFFRQYGMEVDYVGHPLLDALDVSNTPDNPENADSRTIALLPGSRKQEIQRILPPMLAITARFPQYRFVVAGASSMPETYYQTFLKDYPQVELLKGVTYELLQQSCAALVKSGTSTLETALLNVPQVVCYAGNPLSYHIARRLIQVKYISLVNLIVDKPLVQELIQDELNPTNLASALSVILQPENRAEILRGYTELKHSLGDGGASRRAASSILQFLQQQPH